MRALAALCVRRPVFTWVLTLAIVVLGLSGLTKMPLERFPNMDFAFVSVTLPVPSMAPQQIESEVCAKVENALGTVGGLDRLDCIASEGVGVILAQFTMDKKSDEAANEVRDRMSRLADELPRAARPARIETFNLNAMPIMMVAVESRGDARTPLELAQLAETDVRRALQSIRGVGEVKIAGGEERAMSIVLDPLRLMAAGLTAHEVQLALGRENLEAPGGALADGNSSVGVRLVGRATTAAELEEVVVARRGELAVRLRDLGRVEDGVVASESRASLSGKSAVILSVTKQPGANTVGVADEIRERVDGASRFLPDGVTARVIQDNSLDVRASVHAVAEHLILGAILAAGVVLLFLRSWRATLIAGLAIPASVIGTFAIANALGISLNLLSLLGLTLAVGIVIDDAIVVLENIARVMAVKDLSPAEAAVEATKEIGLAVLATTLSLVAVFLPVGLMEGIIGRYLSPFGLTMSVSILLSMGVAFTLTPMLCARWLKPEPHGEHGAAHGAGHGANHDGFLERYYLAALRFCMRRRWMVGVALVVTLASMVPIVGLLPMTFIPVEDLGRLNVYVRLPDDATVERTSQIAEEIAAKVRGLPDVVETAMTTTSAREASVSVTLGRSGVQEQRIQDARAALGKGYDEQGILTMVGPGDAMAGADGASIQFVVRGADLDELREITGKLLVEAKTIPGTVDHGLTSAGGRPEINIRVDRALASKVGVSHEEIGSALALIDRRGIELGSVRDARASTETTIKIRMRIDSETLKTEDLVRAVAVRNEQQRLVPLSELASTVRGEGPGTIRRVGRERQITVFMSTLPGTSDMEVVEAMQARLKTIDPSGRYRGEVIGNAKEMLKAVSAFGMAIGLSFVFMYLILAAQFESWIHPITILVSLPLTIPFGLISLVVGGQSLNLFSALGFLVLFGVVKKNSILQVDRIIQLRLEGMTKDQAILAACADRLRPIVMTTLAFVAGMLPLVVSSGAGAAVNRAIAVGILGGQTLSLGLTLLATPIVYAWFDDLGAWWARRKKTNAGASSAVPRDDSATATIAVPLPRSHSTEPSAS